LLLPRLPLPFPPPPSPRAPPPHCRRISSNAEGLVGIWRRIEASPVVYLLQSAGGEFVQSVAFSIAGFLLRTPPLPLPSSPSPPLPPSTIAGVYLRMRSRWWGFEDGSRRHLSSTRFIRKMSHFPGVLPLQSLIFCIKPPSLPRLLPLFQGAPPRLCHLLSPNAEELWGYREQIEASPVVYSLHPDGGPFCCCLAVAITHFLRQTPSPSPLLPLPPSLPVRG
jgi:hypothetical protein